MNEAVWGQLYLIAGGGPLADAEFLARVRDAIAGGVGVVQFREKGVTSEVLHRRGAKLRELCAATRIPFVVNDDPEIARILEADGVHVGQDDLDPERVREIVGPSCRIGWSTHDDEQVRHAQAKTAVDLIGIGPVFPTRTKVTGPTLGVGAATQAAAGFTRGPAYAIGGIDVDGARSLAAAGLDRVAVASAILDATDVAGAAAEIAAVLG